MISTRTSLLSCYAFTPKQGCPQQYLLLYLPLSFVGLSAACPVRGRAVSGSRAEWSVQNTQIPTSAAVGPQKRQIVTAHKYLFVLSFYRRTLLGPFHGAIAVSSVTHCRCRRRWRRWRCRGHRCAGGVTSDTWWMARAAARSGEWAQHFSNASCIAVIKGNINGAVVRRITDSCPPSLDVVAAYSLLNVWTANEWMKIQRLQETTGHEGSGRPLTLALILLHTYTHT